MTQPRTDYDTIVVGGGPSGATAAHELANKGHRVLLLERGFRIKPCGGAIPPCLLQEFNICLLYTSPSPRDRQNSRMPSSA